MTNAIFLTFDDGYLEYAKICINSLEKNYPDHPEILVAYNGHDPEFQKFSDTIKNLRMLPYKRDFLNTENLKPGVIKSPQVFYRYILWTEEFDNYDTILHLDVDTVILKPLDELFTNKDFFAVCDFSPNFSIFKNQLRGEKKLLNLLSEDKIEICNYPFDMMNAGVFVIPKKARSTANFSRLLEITRKYNDFMMFADQSAISLWCHSSKISFSSDIRFNFQFAFFHYPVIFYNGLMEDENIFNDIHILHFARYKPDSRFYKNFLNACHSFIDLSSIHKKFLK